VTLLAHFGNGLREHYSADERALLLASLQRQLDGPAVLQRLVQEAIAHLAQD